MDKLTVVKIDDLIVQVVESNGGTATSKELAEAIDAKPLTIAAATRRLVATERLCRLGQRGRFADGATASLVSEAKTAGLDATLTAEGRVSISLADLRKILD